jgi:hypothetical protein
MGEAIAMKRLERASRPRRRKKSAAARRMA